jgi:saxitoxin biosynthesis operon SxtJ-like protein
MLLAEALAYVSTRIILGFVFFAIVTPIGVVKRMFGWDPLHRPDVPGLPIGDLIRIASGILATMRRCIEID